MIIRAPTGKALTFALDGTAVRGYTSADIHARESP